MTDSAPKKPLPERKPAAMSWESFAEERIRQAQEAGAFDNLPGMGKPIPSLEEPDDEWWWIKQKLRREKLSLLPPALEIRLEVSQALASLDQLSSEQAVRQEVDRLNGRIREANLKAIWGPPSTLLPLDAEEVLAQWKAGRQR